jgi:indole-3-glycerol phosphate synthase
VERIHACSANPIIAELKPASPSEGRRLPQERIAEILQIFSRAGVVGLSVLTEPMHFHGSLENLRLASAGGLPTLMKDFVIDPLQLEACVAYGGSALLLIVGLFRRGYSTVDLNEMIALAHQKNLEVVLEVNSLEEFHLAQKTEADMIGINNRDLGTLHIDLGTTRSILQQVQKDRIVWSMSGIENAEDLDRLKQAGADAFLVGTSLMRAENPEDRLTELLEA